MPDKFFKVNVSPKLWTDSSGGGNSVVTMAPWERAGFSVGGVKVKGRKSWHAPQPIWTNEVVYYNSTSQPLTQLYNNIVIHHTNNSGSILDNEKKQQSKLYAALGYHFFIDKNADVYEGRPIEIMGSHAGRGLAGGVLNDPDFGSLGIVLQGDYHHKDDWFFSSDAPRKQFDKLEKLVKALKHKYQITRLLMHKEVVRSGPPTVCPGDHLASKVKALRSKLNMRGKE